MTDEETPAAETPPEGVTKAEFGELKTAVEGLASRLEDLAEASTPKEEAAAKEKVTDAKADLKTIAGELGIDPKRLEAAADNARREQRKEELRPLLVELLDEELADEITDALDGNGDRPKDEKKEEPEGDGGDPPEDSGPVAEHWSEGPIGGLLGLGGRK